MGQLLPLQKYAATDYNGLVTDNHFHALYQQEPQLISQAIREIYKTNLQGKLREFVDRFPTKEVEQENGFYTWMLQGQHNKNLPLADAETIGGASISAGTFPTNVGANGERFYLIFEEALFEETNVLKGETDEYHLLVKKALDAGSRFKYEVEIFGLTESVPSEELAIGTRWSKFYSAAPSTLSYQGAKPNFTSPWRMENRPSTLRMEYQVAGNTINKGGNEPLKFGFKYNGKEEKMWINYQDLVAHHQCEEMFARMQIYGKRNWTPDHQYLNKDDKTKYAVESGAGFFEQIAPSNVHYYNSYDLDWHLGLLMDMGVGKLDRGKRVIHLLTGEWGAVEISTQIQAKQGSQFTIISDKYINGNSAPGNLGGSNTKSLMQPQYNVYQWYNGIEIRVEILDFFDDDTYFPQLHPDGKGLVESHRILALNYGEDAGIYRIKPKGTPDYQWGYIPGMRDPFTPAGKGAQPKLMASSIDGYEVHLQKWGGMMVEDPTGIVDLRLNVAR
jgi:hypothetical protein